ncbi:hypothetical protein HHI36_009095 [Cryptolaemus montrouzieri]|uniref:Odorant receptor n=1 Tax=Cryptolaemus montrouzieri TaxID=559131 RepID=A0ABD2MUF9_9CUCU
MLGKRKYAVVMRFMLIVKLVTCLNILLSVVASFGFILSPDYFNRKTYLAVWIIKTFPEYSKYMLFVVSLTSFPVAIVLAGSPIAWAYAGTQGWCQLMVLNEAVEIICVTKCTPKNLRRDSKIYQEVVKEKLILCIFIHQMFTSENRILEIGMDLLEKNWENTAMDKEIPYKNFRINFQESVEKISLLREKSCVMQKGWFDNEIKDAQKEMDKLYKTFKFTNGETDFDNYRRQPNKNQGSSLGDEYMMYLGILCFALAGGISSTIYVFVGQLVKDESEKLHYLLLQVPWYYMNIENRRMYLLFLRKSENPLTLSSSLVVIDFLLLVRIVKALYSMAALLARFVSSSAPMNTN